VRAERRIGTAGPCGQSPLREELLGLVDRDVGDPRLLIHPSVLVQGLVFGLPQRSQDSRLVRDELRLPRASEEGEAVVERGIWVAGTASGDTLRVAAAPGSSTLNKPQTITALTIVTTAMIPAKATMALTLTSLVSWAMPSLCISSGG
jgi:hypothetical protein